MQRVYCLHLPFVPVRNLTFYVMQRCCGLTNYLDDSILQHSRTHDRMWIPLQRVHSLHTCHLFLSVILSIWGEGRVLGSRVCARATSCRDKGGSISSLLVGWSPSTWSKVQGITSHEAYTWIPENIIARLWLTSTSSN